MILRFTSILTLVLTALFIFSSLAYAENHISHAIAIHGTPKYEADAKYLDYVNPKAKKGGTLRKSSIGTFDSLNPLIPKGNSAIGLGLVYESLAIHSEDEPFTMYGLIAENIEWPEDKSWVIFHINPKAKFHDGHAITAEDVVFSFNTVMANSPMYQAYWADVAKVEAITPLKAKFTFKPTQNPELIAILSQLLVLPKHFWKGKEFNKADLSIPLGSGPYKITDVKAGKTLTFERVDDHWAKDHFTYVGRYNFDKVVYEYYRDRSVTFEAFKANEFDIRYETTAKTWATGYDFPAVKSGKVKILEIEDGNPKGMTGFFMNQRRKTFQNINFRKALDYAFDYEWTNANIFHDSYKRTQSFYTNSEFASNGPLTGKELEILKPFKKDLPESVFNGFYTPPKTDGKGNNRKNLKIAKELLEQAGYKITNNKLIDPSTREPVEFDFLMYDSVSLRIVNPYIKNLSKLGITANPVMVDQSQYLNRMRTFDYDMTTLPLGQSLSPGNEQFEYWHSNNANKEGSSNYLGLNHKVIDALVDAIVRAPTKEDLIYQTRALDRVLLNYHFVVPLYHNNTHRLAFWDKFQRPQKHAKYDVGYSAGFFTWWIDDEKEKTLSKDSK